ncbi:RNA polymerase sigma factor [Neolewinella antarctica]|uniref:RNA polymerase sigma-70 factor (ECF subfamily) n=1 Tax=Neolewinella antarctica TaxID=442734 RepID=A0ABX0XD10_9BACT|nr:RNA polymerase sigma factor [Neolewinella antarctica]NJC27097.1 RNA polymerase sigma-70 factor (ECF subfamily) [Neolewinella antarctica]
MHPEKDKQTRFLAAYAQVHEGFLRYCSALAFERMDVEDLVQDALLAAYKKFDELTEPAKLQGYLIRVARNRSVSFFRSSRQKAELTDLHAQRLTARGAGPEELADVHLLYRAIHKLPAKQRDAVLLYEISGYPQREIAELLGVSEPAVKMLLQRARKKLTAILTEPGTNLTALLQTAKSIAL